MQDNEKFDYTYSAPTESERREIESIKKQYTVAPEEESPLENLRNLNKRVTRPPFIAGVLLGIAGTLILGLGMAMVMEWNYMAWGIVVGLLGVAIVAAAYPVYRAVLRRNKRKYGRQIVRLSDELLNNEEKKR